MQTVETPIERQEYFENEYAEYWVEDGVMVGVFKPHVQHITLPMAKEIVAGRLKVTAQRTMPLFVDLNNFKSAELDAKKYFSEGEAVAYINASAFFLHSYLQYSLAKIFFGVYKPKPIANVFRIRSKAIDWLKKYRMENQ